MHCGLGLALVGLTLATLIDSGTRGVAAGHPLAARPSAEASPPARRRYCSRSPFVGAWVATRTCRDRAEWLRDGIDQLGPR